MKSWKDVDLFYKDRNILNGQLSCTVAQKGQRNGKVTMQKQKPTEDVHSCQNSLSFRGTIFSDGQF